jgi:hypothetical protein
MRIDSTTASDSVTEDGLSQLGYSKDHRPDLSQLKVMLSALDLPVPTQVGAGNSADNSLYLPAQVPDSPITWSEQHRLDVLSSSVLPARLSSSMRGRRVMKCPPYTLYATNEHICANFHCETWEGSCKGTICSSISSSAVLLRGIGHHCLQSRLSISTY